ncbi:PolC-type DNA polymerase III [Paratissierella segnis]|uniref:PolC-type DNA polymerase III n=1 Tax=Paratissierella segnis TaxID=2763679 RepID=UPI00223B5CAF|nr:PolC-type DNA polymerase III [Paratissierella segnis]
MVLLKNIINDDKYSHLAKYNINIEKVTVLKADMELILDLEIGEEIEKKIIEDLNLMFTDIFKDFKIKLNKIEKIPSEGINIDALFNDITELILEEIPSGRSWIKGIEWEVEKDYLKLILPNQMAFFSVKRNGLVDNITKLISSKLDSKFLIEYKEDNSNEYFLEEKEIEEREISKNILENVEFPTKSIVRGNSKKSNGRNYSYGKSIKESTILIKDIDLQLGTVAIKGDIFELGTRDIKGKRTLVIFSISDGTDSITVKSFLNENTSAEFLDNVKEGSYVLLEGDVTYDNYSRDNVIMLKSLVLLTKEVRKDTEVSKRVELHVHSQMSSMDGITSIKKIVERASIWGHKSIAVTDHGVVQAFPEAMDAGKQYGVKILYGVEGYMVNDQKDIVTNIHGEIEINNFVVFDLETTGLSAKNDRIIEIGAVKIVDGNIVDEFSQLIDPEISIPKHITEITSITNDMVEGKPYIKDILPLFKEFIGDCTLVAHNANFDMGFIREKMKLEGIKVDNPVLDTLELSRAVFPNLKSHKLNIVAKHLDISLVNHHRAVDDASATGEILLKILEILEDKNFKNIGDLNSLTKNRDISKGELYHVIILVKNYVGLKNLYSLISDSHIKFFHRKPRMPKSLIEANRDGLIIGSACEAGELYRAILNNKSYNEIRDIVKFYDYLEIQPLGNNMHLVRDGVVKDEEELKSINKRIYELGKTSKKLVVATGDIHFLEPEDEVYRRILMSGQGFSDADLQAPLYFKSTNEMLDEFSYLGEDTSREVVITNTNLISDSIEEIIPVPSGTFPPIIEGADEDLKRITYKKAYEIYGDPLPEIVEERLNRELTSIIKNGYAVMYIIAQKLVWKSNADGYLVGSRGSVGSSFVATMSGITEVNPLAPHYVCPKCKYSEFFTDGIVASGSDLQDKNCPKCNSVLNKDGQDIPFEVFLGFEGDKEPDIDLNFAGEYQSNAHKYTEELFGEGYVFRAGTIGTIADKTAYGFVKKYFEKKEMNVSNAEINRLVKGFLGIKRTSGQHPGGVMIVPKYKDILDFTPIQYPADDKSSGVITTHFDYNAISGRILKLDILGHDVPTIIRMLEDITGIDPTKIPLDETKTMKIFTSTEPLGIKPEDINCPVGTLGIPEFGTRFVRQMLVDTQPSTFSELVRISGLSHGTNVWVNNAQDLVRNNIAPLSKVISTREDIMLYLINAGMDKKKSFFIMEKVRKGRGLSPEDEEDMRALDLPDWYIESCNKIKYMFPKAHAVAYVMMSFRIAYFKVYYPEAFYATYFTIKAADFDGELIIQGKEAIKSKIMELENLGNNITAKEKNLLTVLEVALEMYQRGLKFERVDLYKSHSDKFLIGENGILPPLKVLDGVGENAAKKIVEEREKGIFISIEDLVNRGKATKPVIEALTKHGCLQNMPESNQISLFSI